MQLPFCYTICSFDCSSLSVPMNHFATGESPSVAPITGRPSITLSLPGTDVFNIVRTVLFATYLTTFSPSTIYWMMDMLRWVSIWTVIPVQISVYLAFGRQYVTLCCTLHLAARACSLNIAKMHVVGILHEWSAAKQAQELLWILAWFVLAFDLEMAPRLIAMTAATCAAVWAKVWVARWYSLSSI